MKESFTVFLFFNVVAISFLQAHPAGPPGTPGALNIAGCHLDRGKLHCHKKGSFEERWFDYSDGKKVHSLSEYKEQFCETNEGRLGHYVRSHPEAVNHPAAVDKRFGTVVIGCETFEHAVEFMIDTDPDELILERALLSGSATGKEPVVVVFNTDGQDDEFEIQLRKRCDEKDVWMLSVSK